jgi:mycothiol system anti-sigma-R factor
MKSCHDYTSTIHLYLGGELSNQDLEGFRRHLASCESCLAELEAEESLSALLHRSRPLYLAPDALRDRVAKAADSLSPSKTHVPIRLRKRPIAELAQFFCRQAHNWGILATTLLLVAASFLLVRDIRNRRRANDYIETAVAAHRSFLDGNLPLEVRSDSPSVVTAWFADKVPFRFYLPNAPEESEHEQAYRLSGGRLVHYSSEYAALVGYQMQQQKISLLVASSKSVAASGGEELASGGIVFHRREQAGFNVITWTNRGLTYALVSALPGPGRKSCLVCHQNMGDGSRFSAHQ